MLTCHDELARALRGSTWLDGKLQEQDDEDEDEDMDEED